MTEALDRERLHFEPFVHLAEVDDDQALVTWGGFWFVPFADGRGVRIVDDEELEQVEPGRRESIGARARSYGPAVVEAFGPDGRLAARAEAHDANHAWLRGLRPDTEYRYRIRVDGQPWAEGERWSWHRIGPDRGELRPAGRGYDLRFRTFPDREGATPLTFCALGDYGVGIQPARAPAGGAAAPGSGSPTATEETGERQLRIARALERAVFHHDVRLIVTLGDNIYHGEGEQVGGSGREDDDWYFSFYEPYRWLLARLPLYPTVGNHDAGETEASDDRGQLDDNHYLSHRFEPWVEEGRASIDPGLFYRLDFDRRVQFVCVDTTEACEFEVPRYFAQERHLRFLDEALRAGGTTGERRWRIPFSHHPPFCAGPRHHNDEDMVRLLVPRYEAAGVRLVLAGHEHNFQYSVHNDVHYLVSGAGGKLREGRPDALEAAHTRAWAAAPHFLLIRLDGEAGTIWPVADVAEDGGLRCIEAETPEGGRFELPIRIRL